MKTEERQEDDTPLTNRKTRNSHSLCHTLKIRRNILRQQLKKTKGKNRKKAGKQNCSIHYYYYYYPPFAITYNMKR